MEYDFAKQKLKQLGRYADVVVTDAKSLTKIKEYCEKGYIVIVNNMKRTIFNDIEKQYHAQIFSADEAAYCPLDHIKVPPHRKAAPRELKYELPKILSHDIVCRWMGFRPGDVVAIDRDDGKTYFRVVF
jgi:DNA-directed RNA polymerase subunit H (RpoH/RPB5)